MHGACQARPARVYCRRVVHIRSCGTGRGSSKQGLGMTLHYGLVVRVGPGTGYLHLLAPLAGNAPLALATVVVQCIFRSTPLLYRYPFVLCGWHIGYYQGQQRRSCWCLRPSRVSYKEVGTKAGS